MPKNNPELIRKPTDDGTWPYEDHRSRPERKRGFIPLEKTPETVDLVDRAVAKMPKRADGKTVSKSAAIREALRRFVEGQ